MKSIGQNALLESSIIYRDDSDESDWTPRCRRLHMIQEGSRSLAESLIVAYNDILEKEEEENKNLKKRGWWKHTGLRQLSDLGVKTRLLEESIE